MKHPFLRTVCRSSFVWCLASGALTALPATTAAQPVGSEFQVNTYTTDRQAFPSVASDASGNFVVVWESWGQDGSKLGVFGQRYDATGATLGTEFRVNSFTTGNQTRASVASDPSGNFVVVWASSGNQDGDASGIFGQRYDSAGVALGNEFRVNSYTTSLQPNPSTASDASGNFVVVWQSKEQDGSGWGIFGQRYDSAGGLLGSEFRVNSYTTSTQYLPFVACDASGNFVVVWTSSSQDGSASGIFGQRYDSAGAAQGAEFRVNSYTTGDQASSSVASDASGNFVVVWQSYGQDGSARGIFGQRYDSAGVAQGAEFSVNSFKSGNQMLPSVASDASGNLLVAWKGNGAFPDLADGIYGQRYDSAGVAQGDQFQINSYTSSWKFDPSVAATGTNEFVVAWEADKQDGSGGGVFGQRFDFSGAQTITVVRPNTNVKWHVGSVQSIRWTHNLGRAATFRIELDRDDDGTFEEMIAAAARVDSPTRGSFAWAVTGPASGTARVRISWTGDPGVSDASDVTFQIRPG